jgi:hypothetical protein
VDSGERSLACLAACSGRARGVDDPAVRHVSISS